jgi:hypothetical protein
MTARRSRQPHDEAPLRRVPHTPGRCRCNACRAAWVEGLLADADREREEAARDGA